MKKMRYFFGFILISLTMVIINSCTENVPTYTTETFVGCNDVNQTHIKVLVCDQAQTLYFGGAEVFMYLSDAERAADPQRTQYYQKATTDNTDPANVGAVFYKTPWRTYYFFARRDNGGGNFITGTGEIAPKMCTTTPCVITVN